MKRVCSEGDMKPGTMFLFEQREYKVTHVGRNDITFVNKRGEEYSFNKETFLECTWCSFKPPIDTSLTLLQKQFEVGKVVIVELGKQRIAAPFIIEKINRESLVVLNPYDLRRLKINQSVVINVLGYAIEWNSGYFIPLT